MNYRNLNSIEGRTYLEKALILETSGAESKSKIHPTSFDNRITRQL
jgi:hypothetical protein